MKRRLFFFTPLVATMPGAGLTATYRTVRGPCTRFGSVHRFATRISVAKAA